MSEILIESRYLAHEGGTKFYEVIQLYDVDRKRFVLVRRWGKVVMRNGGGDTKVESFGDLRRCQQAAGRILVEKNKRGYARAAAGIGGLHVVERIRSDKAAQELSGHYNDRATVSQILSMLGLDDEMSSPKFENVIIQEGFELRPEPVRDADWGSW